MFSKFYLLIAILVVSAGYAADKGQLPDEPKMYIALLPTKYHTISAGKRYEIYKGNWICGESSDWFEKEMEYIPYVIFAGAWKKFDTSPEVYMILQRKAGHSITDSEIIERLGRYGVINQDCEKCTINVDSIHDFGDEEGKAFFGH